MNKKSEIKIRSIGKLIILHLLPGIIITITYILIARTGFLNDYPKLIQLGFAGLISLVPVELGYLFYLSYKTERTFNIFKILGLKNKMKATKLIVYNIRRIL